MIVRRAGDLEGAGDVSDSTISDDWFEEADAATGMELRVSDRGGGDVTSIACEFENEVRFLGDAGSLTFSTDFLFFGYSSMLEDEEVLDEELLKLDG